MYRISKLTTQTQRHYSKTSCMLKAYQQSLPTDPNTDLALFKILTIHIQSFVYLFYQAGSFVPAGGFFQF